MASSEEVNKKSKISTIYIYIYILVFSNIEEDRV